MNSKINRRDFLKLALTLPLLNFDLSKPWDLLANPNSTTSSPNIIVIVYDALTAVNMSLYGYPRQTTPNLARFAERATVYHANYSAGNFTTPGTSSLFTGTYPWSHRAFHLHGNMLDEYAQRSFFNLTPPAYYRLGYSHNLLVIALLDQLRPYLDEFKFARDLALADLQYSDLIFKDDYTASLWSEKSILRIGSTKPSSLFLAHLFRMWQVLEEKLLEGDYSKQFPQGLPEVNDVYYILEEGINWCIDQLPYLKKPFISYIHFLPPHNPYYTRSDFVDRFNDDFVPVRKPRHRFSEKEIKQKFLNQQRRAYDEFIAYADSEFGRLYDHLERTGLLEDTYLIFTSDHGEMFERGILGHGSRTLYEPVIRVPLIISRPGQTLRQDVYTPTSGVDVLPTLMQIMGQPISEWCEGNILPPFDNSLPNSERSIFAMEAKQNPQLAPLEKGTFTLIKGSSKLIHYRGYEDYKGDRDELYDLANDPEELDNRYSVDKSLAREMKHELETKIEASDRFYNGNHQ